MKRWYAGVGILTFVWVSGTIVYAILEVHAAGEFTDTTAQIKFFLESLAVLVAIDAILLSIGSTQESISDRRSTASEAVRTRQEDLIASRNENSFRFFEQIENPRFDDLRTIIRYNYREPHDPISQVGFCKAVSSDEKLSTAFVSLANLYGRILHSLELNRVNEQVLFDGLSNTFARTYLLGRPWLIEFVPALENDLKILFERWGKDAAMFRGAKLPHESGNRPWPDK